MASKKQDFNKSTNFQRDLLVYAVHEEITDAVEAERKRISDLLQYSIINQINLILTQTSAYQKSTHNMQQAQMALSVLSTLLRQLLQSTLDLQTGLHPAIMETLGLAAALESLANQILRTHGIRMTTRFNHSRDHLSIRLQLGLLRITQSICDLLIEQGETSEIALETMFEDNLLTYRISANGTPAIDDKLETVLQRINLLGGAIQTRSDAQHLLITIQFQIEDIPHLTDREQSVLMLVVEGMTNREIAHQLEISTNTVKFHLDNLYSKLNVNSRTEAAIFALRHGWVKRSQPG